jgi:hypothetical protein
VADPNERKYFKTETLSQEVLELTPQDKEYVKEVKEEFEST